MSAATLFVHRREGVGLAEAVRAFSAVAPQGVGLLYSPRWCGFAVLQAGDLCRSDGLAIDLGPVFEARLFCPRAELRWLNDPGAEGRHQAVVLAEEDLSVGLGGGWGRTEVAVIETLEQTYLLWGEGTGREMPAGWSQLGAARVGALAVPLAGVNKKQRVLLVTREYLAEQDHGNVLVREERLCALVPGEVGRG